MSGQPLFTLGFLLVLMGVGIMVLSVILLIFSMRFERAKGGGVILIGPLPIVFGTDRKVVKWLMVLALTLVIALIILNLVPLYAR
jgi:uncharacterized membrane protein